MLLLLLGSCAGAGAGLVGHAGMATAAPATKARGAVSVFRRSPHPRLRVGSLMRLRMIPVPPSSSRGLVVWFCMPVMCSTLWAMAWSKRAAWGFVSVG